MTRTISVLVAFSSIIIMMMMFIVEADAAPMFVATSQNMRGALYQGCGPTPQHASEQALVKCSQDSFIPPSCKVICVRMECPPPPPVAYSPKKVRKVTSYGQKPFYK